ncbi:uncharacterized protein HMPREF1541_02055 [Cyphellophora europaea CBS 101466]|uniref:HAUS augmin-like complex subunit 6 N-terminal domain-containing protein n=1 Tax=Cyphellophora europaea (strain CBS 101466) TaxID=1220924 RepID=W2S2L0_CYPE1|nr:uncharacterized protein HMPREF1541_02055 [Cyphellophora europaea CBS 101466]ETN42897.1 hypothetical protein HMPREF1541_02055 [Cyphellophora europaea CBS 101466]
MSTRPPASGVGTSASGAWTGRSHISTFIRCLHLLDLDVLDDWPGITVQTFSTRSATQNLQQRVRAVEWSLFRLFELYDPQLSRDKLRPFFPPQSHLQSQNLRAALLRVLTDAKKSGIFSRDVVLRKTTLDECKGEKFEELLSTFAMVVLRKHLQNHRDGVTSVEETDDRTCLPLIIAHRVTLGAQLDQRRGLVAKLDEHERHISARKERLADLKGRLQRHQATDSRIHDDIERLLRDAWTADSRWVTALLRGSVPETSSQASHSSAEVALHNLQSLASSQEERLKELQAFKKTLPSIQSRVKSPPIPNPPARILPRFERHGALQASIVSEDTRRGSRSTTQKLHDDLLQRFRNEMATNVMRRSDDRPQKRTSSPSPLGKGSTHGPKTTTLEENLTENEARHLANPPTRPFAQQESSSASYVERSHLPMSDEISVRPTPVVQITDSGEPSECSWLASSPPIPDHSSETPPPVSHVREAEASDGLSPIETPIPKQRFTLQERTRMSLAGALRDIENVAISPVNKIAEVDEHEAEAQPTLSGVVDNSGNLLERTRKSMSLLTTISDLKSDRRRSKGSRVSQLYPVDPFETPRRTSAQWRTQTPGSNGSTPREKLFDENVEYSSVFKSRPKIAQSPMMSPDRSVLEDDGILAMRAGHLSLSDEDASDSSR